MTKRTLFLTLILTLTLTVTGTAQVKETLASLMGTEPVIVAHRGASSLAPENTMAAVYKALELGIPWVEIDVHRTRDSVLVILHDETLDRTTNGKGEVARKRLNELAELDAGSWFGPEFAGEPIPTLEEVLLACKDKAVVLIELKGARTEKLTVELVRELDMTDQVIIQSFDHQAVAKAKTLAPEIPTFILVRQDNNAQGLVNTAKFYNADGIGIRRNLLTPELIVLAHEESLVIIPWTVDDPTEMKEFLQLGVDGIITNYPQVLQEILAN